MFGHKSILVLSNREKDILALQESFATQGVSSKTYAIHYFKNAKDFFYRLEDFQEAKGYTNPPILIVFLQNEGNSPSLILEKILTGKTLPQWPIIGFGSRVTMAELQPAFERGLNGYFNDNEFDHLAATVRELEWLPESTASNASSSDEWMQTG